MSDCSTRAFDIYSVADVEELKRDHAELRAMYREAVRENARLHERLDRLRRGVKEEDWEWMNG